MTKLNNSSIILTYHKIAEQYSDFIPELSIKVFQEQIKFVRRFYEVVNFERIFEPSFSPKTKICITFDDGYACFYKYAYPLFKKYHLPVAVFLSVESIEKNMPVWTDLVSHYIKITEKNRLELSIQKQKRVFPLINMRSKLFTLARLKLLLKEINNNERLSLLKEIKGRLDAAEPDAEALRMLTWQEVKKMSENGISFGAHTMTHPILTKMPLGEAKQEILESKRVIEEKIKKPVTTFAYPNGASSDFNDDIKKILKENGLKYACSTIFGRNYHNTDPYELRRVYTSGNNIFQFALRLWNAK